jgi:predicted HD phosphohydrolase
MTRITLSSVDDLFDVLAASAGCHDEPDVDLLAHGLQCAANLAASHPDDVELQVAGLAHDIGWVVDPESPHDRLGAALLTPLLGDRVGVLVGGHVLAKRYLVATDPDYLGLLSVRSVETLGFQGGAADDDACARLDADPHRDAIVALRRADDRAKVPGADVAGLATWRAAVEAVAAAADRRPTR